MEPFDHKAIEKKWQERWERDRAFAASDDAKKKKTYLLVEFPYPSGAGLHTGHVRSYTAMDVIARKRRREGQNVLYPIGWDAFGLPTENYAIKTGRNPRDVTKENTDTFRRQLKSLGLSFDWSREINTTDPDYYTWTQWIFIQMFKKGLAYKAKTFINWCPKDKIGLANEEVVDGACERCGTPVEKREKEQWMLAITKYAQRLYDDLDTVDYIERAKTQQRNWIGPSEGAEIDFALAARNEKITVFTTRPDTLFGVTYLVLAPEHELINTLKPFLQNWDEVEQYRAQVKNKTEIERTTTEKEKTGIELKGIKAINPATKEEIPIWIADYVLSGYGTGAIMAVPAHDERDFEFAKKFALPVKNIEPELSKEKITLQVGGKMVTKYKLRDWVFSRQRYWGEPIPMVHCEKDGWVPVPESELPVKLPEVEKYEPTDTGESPLAAMSEWVKTTCPVCGAEARRETDVMPNWAGSSWYYLRYTDPTNDTMFANSEKLKYWTPVDWYNGGMEHTVLHLLYSRFWHKFLYDIGVVPTSEPYQKRTSHGIILAEDGEKMSKSKGNVVNPDEIVERFGADALRVYEMFMGPFDQAIAWSVDGLVGAKRFLERAYKLHANVVKDTPDTALAILMHQTIKKISEDIEALKMNTALSQIMIFSNELGKLEHVPAEAYETLLQLLAPFAPHLTEELWEAVGHQESIHACAWPTLDAALLGSVPVTIAVQVNGKMRGILTLPPDTDQATIETRARELVAVQKALADKTVQKIVYVQNKAINLVV